MKNILFLVMALVPTLSFSLDFSKKEIQPSAPRAKSYMEYALMNGGASKKVAPGAVTKRTHSAPSCPFADEEREDTEIFETETLSGALEIIFDSEDGKIKERVIGLLDDCDRVRESISIVLSRKIEVEKTSETSFLEEKIQGLLDVKTLFALESELSGFYDKLSILKKQKTQLLKNWDKDINRHKCKTIKLLLPYLGYVCENFDIHMRDRSLDDFASVVDSLNTRLETLEKGLDVSQSAEFIEKVRKQRRDLVAPVSIKIAETDFKSIEESFADLSSGEIEKEVHKFLSPLERFKELFSEQQGLSDEVEKYQNFTKEYDALREYGKLLIFSALDADYQELSTSGAQFNNYQDKISMLQSKIGTFKADFADIEASANENLKLETMEEFCKSKLQFKRNSKLSSLSAPHAGHEALPRNKAVTDLATLVQDHQIKKVTLND